MRARVIFSIAILAAVGLLALPSSASNPYVQMPANFAGTPAFQYAEMTATQCTQALSQRQISYVQMSDVDGVDAPVRLSGPLGGVKFTHVRASPHSKALPGSILDCRLVLALHDFTKALVTRDIVEVGFISAHRPDRTGTIKLGQRHPAALAIDIAWFRRGSGTELNVGQDFHGRIGAKTCGARAQVPSPKTAEASQIRELLCQDAGASRLFTLVLTPNYDRKHHNHVHLEVRRGVRWFLVQ